MLLLMDLLRGVGWQVAGLGCRIALDFVRFWDGMRLEVFGEREQVLVGLTAYKEWKTYVLFSKIFRLTKWLCLLILLIDFLNWLFCWKKQICATSVVTFVALCCYILSIITCYHFIFWFRKYIYIYNCLCSR